MKNLDMEKEMMRRGEVMLDAIGDIKDEFVVEASAEEIANHDAESKFTVIQGEADDATLEES
ncbi:MAG: hypothetical protein J5928_03225, partial [Firmicutes bacterium]|nr:hypothetical protein [Bacillota bacterium]